MKSPETLFTDGKTTDAGNARTGAGTVLYALTAAAAVSLLLAACGGGGGGSAPAIGSSSGSAPAPNPSAPAPNPPAPAPNPPAPAPNPPAPAPNPPAPAPNPPAPAPNSAELLITEVSQYSKFDTTHWVELYNPGTTELDLSDFELRSMALKVTPTAGTSSVTSDGKSLDFALPAVKVAPKRFILVASRPQNMQRLLAGSSNRQRVYVGGVTQNGNDYYVPAWHQGGSGFVEIRKKQTDAAVDYVRIGDGSSQGYQPQKQWTGNGTAQAAAKAQQGYGRSLARVFDNLQSASPAPRDTDTAADWQKINFATPGGINDVPANAVDADGDGIPDSAEVAGSTYAGLNLYDMGARQNQRDIFVEIDYMLKVDAAGRARPLAEQDTGTVPIKASLDMVKLAFRNRGIALHFDAGKAFSAKDLEPAMYNLGGGNGLVFEKCTYLPGKDTDIRADGCGNFHVQKNTHSDVRRSYIFHYLLMANSQRADGTKGGASGIAELGGSNILLSLGSDQLSVNSTADRAFSTNLMAGTIMHELGHNLGLRHGGDVDTGDKPNYPSVMNYLYSYGMPSTFTGGAAADRYMHKQHKRPLANCNLSNSPCTGNFVLDYSDGSGSALDENRLNEAKLLGRGADAGAYADWNGNGVLDAAFYAQNLNGDEKMEVLTDYNDWGNLKLPFANSFTGTQQGRVPVQSKQPGVVYIGNISQQVRNRGAGQPELIAEPPLAVMQRRP